MPEPTPTFSFRIRVNRSQRVTLKWDGAVIDLSVLSPGIHLALKASDGDKPLAEATAWVLVGDGYETEGLAMAAGEHFKEVLLRALSWQAVGVDFGKYGPKNILTKYGEQLFGSTPEAPKLNDTHGLMVYRSNPRPTFLRYPLTIHYRKSVEQFRAFFELALAAANSIEGPEELAHEFFHASFFQASEDARFLLLIMTIEALVKPATKSLKAKELIDRFLGELTSAAIDETEKQSLRTGLNNLKKESFTHAARRLVTSRLGDRKYNGLLCAEFFLKSYRLRGQLVHGQSSDAARQEVRNTVENLQQMVADVLAAQYQAAGSSARAPC